MLKIAFGVGMELSIDNLSEDELLDLNRRIVERLRFLQQARAHVKMLQFRIGQRVSFSSGQGNAVRGVIKRYNKKSVTVITDDGQRWNVSPSLLRSDYVESTVVETVINSTPLLPDRSP